MPVEDVMTITGRGTVATGRVERGILKLNDEVAIVGLTDEKKKTVVTGIEMFRKTLDYAEEMCIRDSSYRGCSQSPRHTRHQRRQCGSRLPYQGSSEDLSYAGC